MEGGETVSLEQEGRVVGREERGTASIELCPLKGEAEVLTSGTCECDLEDIIR